MITENLSTLKIHKLTQAQYNRELSNGNIDENALYLTPDESSDLSIYATKEELDEKLENKSDTGHNHDALYYTESEIDEMLSYKADNAHSHAISDVTNLQSSLDSKASQIYVNEQINAVTESLETHTDNLEIHITNWDKEQLNEAYSHATSAHAPSDAEKNIIVGVQRNGVDLTVDSSTRKVDIIVPTTAAEIGADEAGAASSALSSSKEYTNLQIDGLSSRLAFIDEDNEDVTFNSSSIGINIDTSLSLTSTNPVQNRVVTKNLDSLSKEINVERKRINALSTLESGSTTGDRELIDARIDKDGYEYDNVGEHIRGITRQLDENIKKNSISKTCAGNVIVLDDASNNGFEELTIFGHSEQASTTGAQLLPFPYHSSSMTVNGVKFTVNDDSSLYASGVSSDGLNFYFYRGMLKKGTYTISSIGTLIGMRLVVYDNVNKVSLASLDTLNKVTFTVVEDLEDVTIFLNQGNAGVTISGTIYPMLNEGTEALPWEKYTGGKASPSVEFQQPIESVGGDGQIKHDVYNGNIVNSKKIVKNRNESVNVSDDGYTITVVGGTTTNWSDSYIDIVEFPKLKGKKLYVSIDSVSATNVKATKVSFIVVSTTGKTNYSLQDGKKEVVIPYDVKDVYVSIHTNYSENPLSSQNEVVVKGLMVSLSDIPYEPYKKPQTLIASTPNGLPSIPLGSTIPDSIKASKVHMDGVYLDEKTQQYHIADTVSGSGKYVQRIKTLVFDGVTNKMRSADRNYSERYGMNYAWVAVADKLIGGAYMATVGKTPSSNLIGIEGWASSPTNDSMSLTLSDERSGVAVGDNKTTIADKFNVWLQANPVTISYVLAVPIETDLPSSEIEAFKSLKTNKPTTTIINDADARMEVTYYEDMKTYLDESYGQSVAYKEQTLSDNQKQQARQNIGASKVITRTYSGNTIVATDSSEAKFEGLRVFGKSEQISTTGKNLFDYDTYWKNKTFRFDVEPNKVLYRNANIGAGRFWGVYDASGTLLGTFENYNFLANNPLILPSNASYVYVEEDEGLTSDLYIGYDSDTTFEKYSGRKPSPNPEFPQPIESVGDDGSIDVGVYGKNLLQNNATTKTVGGVTFTVNDNGSVTLNGTATKKIYFFLNSFVYPDDSVILSGTNCDINCFIYDDILKDYDYTGTGIEIADAKGKTGSIYIVVEKGTAVNRTIYPMIRLASVKDSTYEPYKKPQTLITTVPNGLPAIKVDNQSIATYTDANGTMWCADEVDFVREKKTQRIGKKVATEVYGVGTHSNGTHYAVIETTGARNGLTPISTHYLGANWSNTDGYAYTLTNNIVINDNRFIDLETAQAIITEEKPEFLYVLATPIETDLTVEEIEAYRALHSNYPNTTILNNANVHTDATLVADTKNYIQKERDDLRAEFDAKLTQILSLLPDNVQAAMIDNETNMLLESEM